MSDLSAFIAPTELVRGLLALQQQDTALVSVKDARSGVYRWVNPAMQAWLAAEGRPVIGLTDRDLLSPAESALLRAADQRALATPAPALGSDSPAGVPDEHRFERQGRRQVFRAWRLVLASRDSDTGPYLLTVWRDAAEAERLGEQLRDSLAHIERQQSAIELMRREHAQGMDRPSELFRREHFEEHLRREVALSQREEREFALVLISIDRSDELRTSQGAPALQRVVESMGELMRRNTRAMDVLAQLGDDLFAILFSGVGLATAHARAEQLRRACATQIVVQGGVPVRFEISAGVASFPHTAQTLECVGEAARQALRDARERGGNQVALARIRLPEAG
jgi:diguanylate cyclase (GGDEF)-like protein